MPCPRYRAGTVRPIQGRRPKNLKMALLGALIPNTAASGGFLRPSPQSGHDFVLPVPVPEMGRISGGLTSPQHKRADIGRYRRLGQRGGWSGPIRDLKRWVVRIWQP